MRELFSKIPRNVRRGLLVLVVVAVAGYLLVPQLAGARQALSLLGGVSVPLVVGATALQVLAILAQAELTREVLPRDCRPTAGAMVRVELTTMAVSHTVPGGTAAGTAVAYRLLRDGGVPAGDAGFALGVRGLGSALILNVLLWLALMVSIPASGFDPLYTAVAGLGLALLAAVGGILLALLRAHDRTASVICAIAARIPFVDEQRVPGLVDSLAERLRRVVSDRALLVRTVVWSSAYWLLSAASLWVFLAAFGFSPRPDSLFVAFGVANVLAVIPVTPRGLGVFEVALIPLLVGFGASRGVAIIGVLAWRLVSFWLPIPAGALAYISLRFAPVEAGSAPPSAAQALGELASEAAENAVDVRRWAAEKGLKVRSESDGPGGDEGASEGRRSRSSAPRRRRQRGAH